MAYTYEDENGQEIIIHDLEESKKLREKYHFPNSEENIYTNETYKKYDFDVNNKMNGRKSKKRHLKQKLILVV